MTNDIQQLQAEITGVRDGHADFRARVRGEVLDQHFSGRWCQPGTEDVLNDLDLAPLTVTFSGEAWVHVHIDNVDGARTLAEANARVTAALDAVCSASGITWSLANVDANLSEKVGDDRPEGTPRTSPTATYSANDPF